MNRRNIGEVAAVFATAILLRILLFDQVGVWGDAGFYLYDARLILDGGIPFIDFLGRSPLFNFAYAGVAAVFGNNIIVLRTFIITIWLLTGIPVYLITREIRGHRVGIVSVALFLWSPFAIVYGMWANTMALAALCATTALYLIVRDDSWYWFAAAGVLFGLAYLSRRSIIVIIGGAGLYGLYLWYKDRESRVSVARIGGLVTGFAVSIWGLYFLMAGGNPGTAYALFEVHTINLLISYGRGGFPIITVDAPIVTNSVGSGRIPIFNDLCQMCGPWTARTIAKTLLITTPIIGIFFFYFRDLTDRYFTKNNLEYLLAILGVLAAYAAVSALLVGYLLRVGAIVVLIAFAVIAYRSDAIDREILYQKETVLLLLVLLGLTTGYLYRNRVLHTYYFMDFFAALSIVGGILYTRAWKNAGKTLRVSLALAIVIGSITGAGAAYPLTNVLMDNNDAGWFTTNNIEDYEEDINARTEPGDIVLSTSPAHVAQSHARTINDNPRTHMVAVRYKDYGPAIPLYESIIQQLESGNVEYVIYGRTMREMFKWNETASDTFQENYCRVSEADSLYQRTNTYLFRYQPDSCPENLRPTMESPIKGDQTQNLGN